MVTVALLVTAVVAGLAARQERGTSRRRPDNTCLNALSAAITLPGGGWLRMMVANAIGRLIIKPVAITQALTKHQIYAKSITTAD